MRKPFEPFKVLSPFTESVTIITANVEIAKGREAYEMLKAENAKLRDVLKCALQESNNWQDKVRALLGVKK